MAFGIFGGQFVDVIEWTDDTSDTMVYRFERQGNEIKYGAMLTVREGQAAVFVHEGQLADVFTPGLYMLETNNMPILTKLQHWHHGFQSPFKSEIYFVSTNRFTDLKWGTKNPIMLRDPEFGPTRIRAYGTYTVKVKDAGRFMTEIVGTDGEFTTDEVTSQIRNIIVQEFIKEAKAEDIRAFVVDGKVVGAMKRVGQPGEFRSNLHKGGQAEAVKLTRKEQSRAIRAAKSLNLAIAGVDLLRSARGPLVIEVNSSPGLEGIEMATGKNIAGEIIQYIERGISQSDRKKKDKVGV